MNNAALVALCSGLLLLTSTVQGETLQQAVAECKLIKADSQRLACFDALQTPVVQSLPAQPSEKAQSTATIRPVETSAAKAPVKVQPVQRTTKDKQSKSATTAQTAKPATSPDTRQPNPEDAFGLAPKTPVEKIERITSTVTNIDDGPRGARYVYLQNGSVWKQTDSNRMRLKTGQDVYVERGLLGSFYMSYEDVNSRIKVKRIK